MCTTEHKFANLLQGAAEREREKYSVAADFHLHVEFMPEVAQRRRVFRIPDMAMKSVLYQGLEVPGANISKFPKMARRLPPNSLR